MVSLSLPRSLAFSKTFAEFRTGEGERARPLLHAPRGAGPGRGAGIWGDWAQLRERGGNARSRLPVGAPAAAPRGRTCPAQAAPSPARGKGRGWGGAWEGEEGAGRGWAGEEGREEERQAGEERGGYRERRQKEAGQRRALAPKWEKGASEREGRGASTVAPSCPWAGALAAVVHGRPSAVIPAARESGAQLARVSRSGAGLGRDGRTAAAGSPSARPPFPLSRARGPSAPPAEPCFPQVPGRCPR